MKPEERENGLYRAGKRCSISSAETILFDYLDRFVDPGSRILDVGCGSGEVAQRIKEKGYEIAALDFSPVAVELARDLGLDCRVADLDTGIPFPDSTFDAVWAGDVIEHVFDPISFLKEIRRVLGPGGSLLCTIPYDLKLTTRLRILFGHSYQEGVYKKYGQYKHHTFFSLPLLRFMFREARLEIQKMRFVIRFPKTKREFISGSWPLIYFAKTMVIRAIGGNKGQGQEK